MFRNEDLDNEDNDNEEEDDEDAWGQFILIDKTNSLKIRNVYNHKQVLSVSRQQVSSFLTLCLIIFMYSLFIL